MYKTDNIPNIRRYKILELIKNKKLIAVSELIDFTKSSKATITRDLRNLESEGLIKRSYGGITYIEEKPSYSFSDSSICQIKEKKAIAKVAFSLLKENDTMITNPGTTTLELCKNIVQSNINVFVITNSLKVLELFAKNNRRNVFCIGGDLNLEVYAFTGQISNIIMGMIQAEIGFIGVHGIDLEAGITLPISSGTELLSTLSKQVKQKVILADHSKFGKTSLYKVEIQLQDIDKIITDTQTDEKYIKALEKKGIEVLIADPEKD
ncbi:MAG: DeoR/GlpR family DNA-binding transcription regulator [Actinobacteria bacterium]|nr:DeoR/GlpR family DNA-binding transcription regulator [Actinomycetota bacterium]